MRRDTICQMHQLQTQHNHQMNLAFADGTRYALAKHSCQQFLKHIPDQDDDAHECQRNAQRMNAGR